GSTGRAQLRRVRIENPSTLAGNATRRRPRVVAGRVRCRTGRQARLFIAAAKLGSTAGRRGKSPAHSPNIDRVVGETPHRWGAACSGSEGGGSPIGTRKRLSPRRNDGVGPRDPVSGARDGMDPGRVIQRAAGASRAPGR